MTISIWRYSHLVLTIVSSGFLIIVSITGCFLSFEPILEKSKPFYVQNSKTLTLAHIIDVVQDNYEEVLSLKRDKNGFVLLESIEGEFYIDPFTGDKIGEPSERKKIFVFMTSLHRSLFLNALGRAFIGITSFILFFIVFSGVILIIKRQNSVKKFFATIVRDSASQYYHIIFGRITLIPLIVLSLTGTYLSMERFKIIPEKKIELKVDYDSLEESENNGVSNFSIFQDNHLGDLRELIFPLFEDVEEFYHLKLKKKEVYVNQFSGIIESEQEYPFTALASRLSFDLHTGRGSIIWSLVLGLSMISIPYFIYSGFEMTIVRRKGRIKNVYKKDNSQYVILVGSENGSTRLFAKMLHEGLLNAGKASFITDLNNYGIFKKMEHLIVLTSTYGQGDPPTNGSRFIPLFTKTKSNNPFNYAVVGFGSLSYPDYCKFAFDVDEHIQNSNEHTRLMDVHTVNNKSFESFSNWTTQWGDKIGTQIQLPKNEIAIKRKKTKKFQVTYKTIASNNPDDTFLVELKPSQNQSFSSGDLLAIYPKDDNTERLYSMAKVKNSILLSVKRHEKGVCSNYLNNLKFEENLEAYIIKNKEFHYPKKAKQVIMIATGTGIAPFLGMIENNHKKQEIYLYWGAKNKNSFALYEDIINRGLEEDRMTEYLPAYSRAGKTKVYVQNLIERDHKMITAALDNKGVIMICGSIAMQQEVMEVLNKYSLSINKKPISHYKNNNQIRIDCY